MAERLRVQLSFFYESWPLKFALLQRDPKSTKWSAFKIRIEKGPGIASQDIIVLIASRENVNSKLLRWIVSMYQNFLAFRRWQTKFLLSCRCPARRPRSRRWWRSWGSRTRRRQPGMAASIEACPEKRLFWRHVGLVQLRTSIQNLKSHL